MRRLVLTSTTALLAFLLLAPPAWADWVWPLHGEVITPYRNGEDPYASGQHRGIDIAGDTGAPVVAAAGGEVRFAGAAGSSGLTVSIRTADGRFDTSYLHLSSAAVRKGDRIAAGERVGAVGSSGVRSTERAHLHFGVRDSGSRHAYHDPLEFLAPAPPAPQRPREAPAPQPAPVPLAPAPDPVRVPAGRRVPASRRVPAGRRVPVREPAPRGVPVREPAPRRIPARGPASGAVPVRVPAGGALPVRTPAAGAHPLRAPAAGALAVRTPAGDPAADRLAATRGAHRPAAGAQLEHEVPERPSVSASVERNARPEHPTRATASPAPGPAPPGDRSGSGPDLGLVLACLGLLAAAATLGLTGDGQKASRRTGRQLARLVQPLMGRR